MGYVEVEEEVLDIAHYVTGKEAGSILPGHYFSGDLEWEDFEWDLFLVEVERSFNVPIIDCSTEKLRAGTVGEMATYLHELIE